MYTATSSLPKADCSYLYQAQRWVFIFCVAHVCQIRLFKILSKVQMVSSSLLWLLD